MKSIFTLVFALIISISSAFAAQNVIATYRFATVDYTDGHSAFGKPATVYEVSLKSNSTLVTKISTFNSENGNEPEVKTIEKRVKKNVMELLLNDVKALANAKIVTQKHNIVCMMMPSPAQSNDHLSVARNFDYDTNSFKGAVTLVSGPQGCWVHESTSLENEWENNSAQLLKRSLKLLAL